MQTLIQGKGLDIGDSLRERAGQGLETTAKKYFADAVDGRASFSRQKNTFRADLSVHIGQNILVQSHGVDVDPYVAFDTALERVDKRLRRYHRRLRHHRRVLPSGSATQAQHYVLPPLPESGGKSEAAFAQDKDKDHGEGKNHSEDGDHGEDGDHSDEAPVIIAEMATQVDELSVSEAVMRMDISDQPALLFHNKASGRLNMVYQRCDGHIGWIDPGLQSHPAGPNTP